MVITMKRAARAAALVATLMVVTGCSSASDSAATSVLGPVSSMVPGDTPLRIELIRPAVVALEAKLGGAQRYLEVNATPTLVNLFVSTNGGTQAVAYTYVQGKLSDPAAPEPVQPGAATFLGSSITFDESKVLVPLLTALANSQYRVFSVLGATGGGVTYEVTVQSVQGGQIQVPVGPDGSITGAVQN